MDRIEQLKKTYKKDSCVSYEQGEYGIQYVKLNRRFHFDANKRLTMMSESRQYRLFHRDNINNQTNAK